MSEAERKRRLDYTKNRKKWILIQLIAIITVTVIALGSFVTYNQMNKTFYIEYTESGNIDYKVHLLENPFFEDEWLGEDQVYVSTLIDNITADLEYELKMGADEVSFDYSYSVFTQLLIADKETGKPIYDPIFEIKPEEEFSKKRTDRLKISETVNIDYAKYNQTATEITDTLELDNAVSTLYVTMKVNVISNCSNFEESGNNTYSVSLMIPLVNNTVDIKMTSSVPESESKVLACGNFASQNIFKVLGIVFTVIDVLAVIALLLFTYLTRNEDVRYEAKIKKLLSSYRSFIQVITNEFDFDGYKVLRVASFNEMLSIRDIIQSPILMNENEDKTCSRFVIPSGDIAYLFEIKVENYDEIYAPTVEEPEIIVENVDEEALTEALETPTVELEEIEYEELEEKEDDNGVEVIGVVWPERAHKNKIYRYDPNGAEVHDGDIVLVPSKDVHRNKDIIRKAAVAHGNHKIDPESLTHPLKKIIGIVKRKASEALAPISHESENDTQKNDEE